MKLAGGLHYIDGPQGHGKSYFAVRRIHRALWANQYVVTNIPLLPGWSERMVTHDRMRSLRMGRSELVRHYESLYIHTDAIGDLFRFDIPCRVCGAQRRPDDGRCANGHKLGEGRALAIWDESHNDLNNRSWNEKGRDVLLKGATQLRKLGFVAFLVTQHQDNTDAALRRVCGWRVRMMNMREHSRGLFGFRVIPFNFFVASYYPANTVETTPGSAAFYERFLLGWQKRLYDSWGIYSGLYDDLLPLGDRIALPPAGEALTRRSRGGAVPASERHGHWWEELAVELPEDELPKVA